jgi:transposase-like protein
MIDGKHTREAQVVIALGITGDGCKIPLGFIQTNTENHLAIKGLLSDLLNRGFQAEDGLLAVVDGAQGLSKALRETFGDKVVIQRCTWHKRENVLSYLKEDQKEEYKHRLQTAWQEKTYEKAKEKLEEIGKEIKEKNISAYNSLQEGLEETLALHKLKAPMSVRKSLITTNPIESLNSQIGRYIRRVTRWQNSDQLHRWVACALLEAEKRMKRIQGYKKLPELQQLIQKHLEEKQKNATLDKMPS